MWKLRSEGGFFVGNKIVSGIFRKFIINIQKNSTITFILNFKLTNNSKKKISISKNNQVNNQMNNAYIKLDHTSV